MLNYVFNIQESRLIIRNVVQTRNNAVRARHNPDRDHCEHTDLSDHAAGPRLTPASEKYAQHREYPDDHNSLDTKPRHIRECLLHLLDLVESSGTDFKLGGKIMLLVQHLRLLDAVHGLQEPFRLQRLIVLDLLTETPQHRTEKLPVNQKHKADEKSHHQRHDRTDC